MKDYVILVIALVCGALAVFLYKKTLSASQREAPTISVLRLAEDRPLGPLDQVTEQMLESVPLPKRYSASYEGFIKDNPEDRALLASARAAEYVPGGSFLLYRHFAGEPATRFDALIGMGMRAITLSVSSTKAVGFFVGPGSWIDVIGVVRDGSGTSVSNILSAVKVLAIDRHTTIQAFQSASRRSYNTITIEVTPEQLNQYLLAQTRLAADVAVALRNACDVPQAQVACDRP